MNKKELQRKIKEQTDYFLPAHQAREDAVEEDTVGYLFDCEIKMPDQDHSHDWRPDGESYTKTNHENSCDWNNGSIHGIDRIECIRNCEHYKVRRYTCHCGASKEVKLE